MIIGVDPGPKYSAIVGYSGGVREHEYCANSELLVRFRDKFWEQAEVIFEMPHAAGMCDPFVFQTCMWVGRFIESCLMLAPADVGILYRSDVKLHLLGRTSGGDSHVRAALITKLGAPWIPGAVTDKKGKLRPKRSPGPTHGVVDHEWAALAVAVTAAEIGYRSLDGTPKPGSTLK